MNLMNLRNLNSQYRIYQIPFLKEQINIPFMNVLFETIVSKRNPAMEEDFVHQLVEIRDADPSYFAHALKAIAEPRCSKFQTEQLQQLAKHIETNQLEAFLQDFMSFAYS
jgi:hypothetical protein